MKTLFKASLLALTVTAISACGGGGSSSDSAPQAPTNRAPFAQFTNSCTNDRVCSFTSVSTDADGTITNLKWTFPDGSTATGKETSFTFDEYGEYSVTIQAADNDGATDTRTNTVGVWVDLDTISSYVNKAHESIIFVQDFDHRPEGAYDIQKYREDICYNTDIDLYCGGFNSDEGITYEIVQGELKNTFDANRTMGQSVNRILGQGYQELYMTYTVRFSENYTSGADMKINGLGGALNDAVPSGGSGTSGPDGGFNSRYVFRNGLKQYVYHPDQAGDYGDSEYANDITDGNGRLEFTNGITYTIEMRVKMNDAGQRNGEIETFVNGVSVILQDDFNFSGSGAYGINRFMINYYVHQSTGLEEEASFYLDNIILSTKRVVQ